MTLLSFNTPLPLTGLEQTAKTSDDYYTPRWVFERMGITFDIDVCAPPGGVPWVTADRYYTVADDGLAQDWSGRVWMNPPFSNPSTWVHRFIAHHDGVALLLFSKSAWFQRIWRRADAIATTIELSDFAGGQIFLPAFLAAFGADNVEAIGRVGRVRR